MLLHYSAMRLASDLRTISDRLPVDLGVMGVAVGEHLGYLLTGAWTILVGIAFTQTTLAPGWLGIPAIVIGAVLVLCSLEFVGPAERHGWKLAATLTPITYLAWSVWLIAAGVALLI